MKEEAHSPVAFAGSFLRRKEVEGDKNMALNNSNHHWAFLEEIDAPLWVDLTLEANSTNQHIDDDWFYRSHLFHQCSSRQLKAAFLNSGEDSMGLNFDLVGPSSPQLPSSVSKSRGKDFVSKKWRGENQDFTDKRHLDKVLSRTSSCGNSGSSDEMKPKSSFIPLKGTTSSKSGSVFKSSLTGNHIPNCSKPTSSGGDPTCSFSSVTNKANESSTASTITSESGQQQQQKFMEKSNPALSQTNGIFSVIKAGFRKSGITRPAARVEINCDRRKSRGRKSSFSKSSVGSSSNPGSNGRTSTSTSIQYKERSPDSRNVAQMSYATKNRIKPSKVSKLSTHKRERGTANYMIGPNVSKSIHTEATKPKVQYQILRRKPLDSVLVKETKPVTTVKSKKKPAVGGSNRLAAPGKENLKRRIAGSQKCNNKGIAPVTMVWSPKGTKQSILRRTDRTGLAGKEEIDAPLWVDLTLEANSTNQHIDDDWFYRSHLFHQCSSRQLKAAFLNSGEDSMGLNFDLVGPSSPQLPSSVSKSRGKDFVSKKWRGENQDFTDKRHLYKVLSRTSSCGNSGSSDEMKPKSSFIQLKGTTSSKSGSVCKSSLTGNHIPNCSKPTSSGGDPTCSFSSVTNKANESSTASTITSESGQQQQQKFMEKSNPALSQTNGIFSVIKTGFRKSGITRPAARVEINCDRRKSRGRKSSFSKSSVGSSSNPGSNGRTSASTSIQYKERSPDSRNVARMSYATKNRIKPSKVSKLSTHKSERGTANYIIGPNVSKSIHTEAAKPKVQYQILRRKPLDSVLVKETKPVTTVKSKKKPAVGGSNRLAAPGKENLKRRIAGSQKCNNKGIAPVTMVWSPKGTKQSILQRTDRTGLAGRLHKLIVDN